MSTFFLLLSSFSISWWADTDVHFNWSSASTAVNLPWIIEFTLFFISNFFLCCKTLRLTFYLSMTLKKLFPRFSRLKHQRLMRFFGRREKIAKEIITDNEPLKLSKIDRKEREAKWDVSDHMKLNCLKNRKRKKKSLRAIIVFRFFFVGKKSKKNEGNQLKVSIST